MSLFGGSQESWAWKKETGGRGEGHGARILHGRPKLVSLYNADRAIVRLFGVYEDNANRCVHYVVFSRMPGQVAFVDASTIIL